MGGIKCPAKPSVMVTLPCNRDAKLLWQYAKTLDIMAAGVAVGANMNDTIKLSHPSLVRESGTYLLYKPSYSQFYGQIATFSLLPVLSLSHFPGHFRYRGNRGKAGANCSDTFKLADLVNPRYNTRIWDISSI